MSDKILLKKQTKQKQILIYFYWFYIKNIVQQQIKLIILFQKQKHDSPKHFFCTQMYTHIRLVKKQKEKKNNNQKHTLRPFATISGG